MGENYLEMIKRPRYGYGKNMNPCIACRIFMLKEAKKAMVDEGADFIFTGEVLGERPMSQGRRQLKLIEKESGLESLILRPLSAKLLEPTIPEKSGVDRERLLSIEGRSRRPQIELAKKFGFEGYATPSCLLTDQNFSRRLREAFSHGEEDVELLKYGRHFRLPSGKKVVVGRDEKENEVVANLAGDEDILLEAKDLPGPITLLKNSKNGKDVEMAASICLRYSDCKGEGTVEIKGVEGRWLRVKPMDDKRLEEEGMRI
jgi:hypothetical protein